MVFLEKSFPVFMTDALFKVKKQLLPCLLAVAKHIDYADFKTKVLATFMTFSSDHIWGVRRVCIELLPDFFNKVAATEGDNLVAGLDCIARCLTDESRWVKN